MYNCHFNTDFWNLFNTDCCLHFHIGLILAQLATFLLSFSSSAVSSRLEIDEPSRWPCCLAMRYFKGISLLVGCGTAVCVSLQALECCSTSRQLSLLSHDLLEILMRLVQVQECVRYALDSCAFVRCCHRSEPWEQVTLIWVVKKTSNPLISERRHLFILYRFLQLACH